MPRLNAKKAQEIRERIKKWDDYWRENREQYHDYHEFIMGDMWTEDESKLFMDYKKVPLTSNKLAPLTSYMLGEQQQNTPTLQVSPDDNAPEETVEIREALVKNITFESNAKLAYQHGYQCSIIGGFGAAGVNTKYENEYSFNQDIIIETIKDPCKCYWDMAAESPCKTDGMFAGKRTRVSRKKFREMHGDKVEKTIPSSTYAEDTSLMSTDLNASNDRDSIVVIDDYERGYDTIKIYKLSDGRTVDKKELDAMERIDLDGVEIIVDQGMPLEIVDEREAFRYKVTHRKYAGDYELEKNDFPSEQLPIVFIDQNSYWDKDGKQICRPFFKDARDTQRYLNYLRTQSAYIVKVSRYDQFMAAKSNVKSEDTQRMWRNPNIQQGALFYDESPNGNKPERLAPPELSQSLTMQYELAMQDIQTSTGIYSTQIGQMGNEASGRAIDKRTRQSSYNTSVPQNQLDRAIACIGQIIEEMIPRVYDSERLMMLKMNDQMIKPTEINKPIDDFGSGISNDMTKGRYKVRLLPGPSYEGQKQEALESLQLMLQADPTSFKLVADLMAENLPCPNNIELRNRFRTVVPPEIIEAGKTGKPLPQKQEQPPPELMLAMEQQKLEEKKLQLEMQEAQQKVQMEMKEIEMKQAELQQKMDHDSQRVTMEWQKLEAEKLEAAAKLEEQEMRFRAEMARIHADADISHANNIAKLLMHAGDIHQRKHEVHVTAAAKNHKPEKGK